MEDTMTARCRPFVGVLVVCLGGSALPQTFGQVNSAVPPKEIRVTLLGTASGPRAFVDKAGISTLVEAGGERLLFDAGRGFMQRLVQAGFPMNAVSKLFLTHLHSDHVIGVPDLMLTPWSAAPERKVPLEVWGPDGTRDMVRHLEEAFAFDIHMRRDVDESFSPDGIRMLAQDIRPGKVYEKNGVTVTAFLVSHGLVKPSYGYRVDYAGRSVALSGDTSPSDDLAAACKGVDVLIHEAIDLDVLRRLVPDKLRMDAIVERHTTPEQAAGVFNRVSPRLAVFSHSPGTAAIVEQTRRSYRGRVEMGEDLMVIDIGTQIRVTRAASEVRPQ
jgi:ribonuclease Z